MPKAADYRGRAEELEAKAQGLPAGFERDELLRRAAAYRDLADTLSAQDERREGLKAQTQKTQP